MASNRITLQSGIREYNGDLSKYTGMLGGLTPDVHTLRSLNPETTNRVICVMYRGPYFLMKYFNAFDSYEEGSPFWTYKKVIEYYNMGIQCNIQDQQLATVQLQGGFAGRTIPIPTTQNAQQGQSLTITVPELVGRPIANVHNMWVNGIADQITGLTTYHGMVAGSEAADGTLVPVFNTGPSAETGEALEPSPAWEVAEFLIIALDRSGARVEAAIAALGCIPAAQVGSDIFNHTNTGQSALQQLQLQFNCQFVQSAYINDLAARYVNQFAIFGNSLNYNPGAGDAFFKNTTNSTGGSSTTIDTKMFNNGNRPTLDAVQSEAGNYPAFKANNRFDRREGLDNESITPYKHGHIYSGRSMTGSVGNSTQSIESGGTYRYTAIEDGYTETVGGHNS
jgi:hypothetical protein